MERQEILEKKRLSPNDNEQVRAKYNEIFSEFIVTEEEKKDKGYKM